MTSHDDAERAYVEAVLELQQERLDRAIAEMQDELDLYRDDFTGGHDEVMRAHRGRVEDHKAWLAGFLRDASGASDEPAPTDVAGGLSDRSGSSTGSPNNGHGPRQPHPYEAELERARAIRDMPMSEYAGRRAELGVQSPMSMNRLFWETR